MNCIHCNEIIDEDRLEFLVDYNKPLTCKSCSMEPAAKGYVKQPKPKKKNKIVQMTQEQHILKLGREEYQRFKDDMQGNTNANKMKKLLTYGESYYLYVINYQESNEFNPKYDINYRVLCIACLLIKDFERGKDELDKYQKVG